MIKLPINQVVISSIKSLNKESWRYFFLSRIDDEKKQISERPAMALVIWS